MTLDELLTSSYQWADQNADLVLLAGLLIPLGGTVLAHYAKGGKTDADGKLIASLVMGFSIVAVILEVVLLFVARASYEKSLLDVNAALPFAPVLCLGGSIVGIRQVFPLSQLGSVRTAADMGLLVVILAGLLWLFSRFRGWGLVFIGSFGQLVIVSVVGLFFIWRLWRRAFGMDKRAQSSR
jgi:hypothetical protein